MDYFEIGQRIRKIRRARGMSQEKLAELVDISVTHMSHIETANTKLSLPVFVDIANALNVHADALLADTPQETVTSQTSELLALLETCDMKQLRVISEIVKAAKQAMDAHL